jgi:hypothetical protein
VALAPRGVRAQPAPVLRDEAGTHTQRSAAGLLMQLACHPDAVPLVMSVMTASVCDAERMACALQASTPVRSWRSCGSKHGVCRPLRSHRSRAMLAASRCRVASRWQSSGQNTVMRLVPGRWCDVARLPDVLTGHDTVGCIGNGLNLQAASITAVVYTVHQCARAFAAEARRA